MKKKLKVLYEKIENGDYDMEGGLPRLDYDEKLIGDIKKNTVGTWDEINKKIEEAKAVQYNEWVQLREEYYKGQRKLNLKFEKDVIECYGMTGHPKAQEAFNMAREAGTVEEIIDQFGELSKLMR